MNMLLRIVGLLLCLGVAHASPWQPVVSVPSPGVAAFAGLGDIQSYTSFYSCSRAYSAAYAAATGSNPACKLLNLTGGVSQVISVLSNGNFDTASANTFAGSHTTCTSFSMSATSTGTFAGCGATPTQFDYVTGVTATGAIIKPLGIVSCGSFTGGGGTCTMVQPIAGTYSTVSLTSVNVQNGLAVEQVNDQTTTGPVVNGDHNTPWFPDCGNAIPCAWPLGAGTFESSTNATLNANSGFTAVAGRSGNFTSYSLIMRFSSGDFPGIYFSNAANTGILTNSSNPTFTMSDNVLHTMQGVQGTSGFVYVDSTLTSGLNAGALASTTSTIGIIGVVSSGYYMIGPWYEAGTPAAAFTSGGGGTALSTHANQCAFYGTTC